MKLLRMRVRMLKGKEKNALQYMKTLRDLIELRNQTLLNVKSHLLGRGETGVPNEPDDVYEGSNAQVEFERDFQKFMSPWTEDDLNLKCEDCGVMNIDVTSRMVPSGLDLCNECYEKRKAQKEGS